MTVRLFPVRHCGAASARALRTALDAWSPTAVVIEAPPEAEALLLDVGGGELAPPVAMLAWDRAQPERSLATPLAAFSPEWVALSWAVRSGAGLRFADLPMSRRLALASPLSEARDDQLAALGREAGWVDPAEWWAELLGTGDEDGWERARQAIRRARVHQDGPHGVRASPEDSPLEARREAAMRQVVREVVRQGHARIAVVVGAWHAPALEDLSAVGEDRRLLTGLDRVRVGVAWIPWTHDLLRVDAGYGAGVDEPAWTACWAEHGEEREVRWVGRWTAALREHGTPASAAGAADALWLAAQLASLRELARPGVEELDEAVAAVFPADAVAAVRARVHGSEAMGRVPVDGAAVPLLAAARRDLRRLRLPTEPRPVPLELDLRQVTAVERSSCLHRLRLLGAGARRDEDEVRYRENWTLRWGPQQERALVASSPWGTDLASAAAMRLSRQLERDAPLAVRVAGVHDALLAGLPSVVGPALQRVEAAAGARADELLVAAAGLADAASYGFVRADRAEVGAVAGRLLRSGLAALPSTARDPAAAGLLLQALDAGRRAARLLTTEQVAWKRALERLAVDPAVSPRIAGRAARMAVEDEVDVDVFAAAQRRLDPNQPDAAAAWIEGLVEGSATALVHRPALWQPLDRWLHALGPASFERVLPALHRAFASLPPTARDQLAAALAQGEVALGERAPVDGERAAVVRRGVEAWTGPLGGPSAG